MSLGPKMLQELTLKDMKKKLIEILPILNNFNKFRVKGSNKRKNVGYLYYDEQTKESVLSVYFLCNCSQRAIEVPSDSQSQERKNFQTKISGNSRNQPSKTWLISTTDNTTTTYFDNAHLEPVLRNHICNDTGGKCYVGAVVGNDEVRLQGCGDGGTDYHGAASDAREVDGEHLTPMMDLDELSVDEHDAASDARDVHIKTDNREVLVTAEVLAYNEKCIR